MAAQEKKLMKTRYENRKTSILKKGKELSTLCDVKVCVIIVSPDGKLETWPDNLNEVKAILSAVKESRKPIRSENLGDKKGGNRLCSRIKIPKSVKGKEIEENCVFGNADACVVDEVFYDVSGTDQENNNNAQREKLDLYNSFGMGNIPAMSLADMTVNQTPSSHYHWNGNGNEKSNSEKFGKYIGDMVITNQEPNLLAYYGCGLSSSSAFCNMQAEPIQESSLVAHHQQQYVIGNSSALSNSTGINNFCNMVHPNQAYQQYGLMGNTNRALNYEVNNFGNMVQEPAYYQQYGLMGNSNQEPSSSLAYQQYEIGIWE